MRLSIWISAVGLGLMALVSGCARHHMSHASSSGLPPGPATVELPGRVERGSIQTDVSGIPSTQELDDALGTSRAEDTYVPLAPDEAQCLAAANDPLANLSQLDMSLAARPKGKSQSAQQAAAVMAEMLALRALDQRNRAAASALELYYQLAEAEAGRDALDKSLALLDEMIANVESLRAKGLQVAVDLDEVHVRRIELLDKQVELRLTIDKLNSGLRTRLGVDNASRRPFWPTAQLAPAVEPIDVDSTVAEGLGTRADLAVLRLLATTLSGDTLAAVQSALQSAGMAPTGAAAGASLWSRLRQLLSKCDSFELATRAQQLAHLSAGSERAAAEEIRAAALTVETRLRQVALAKETLARQQQRLATLRKRREVDGVTPFDVLLQELAVVEAESDLVHQVVAWELALVDLKESQGLLALECGHGIPGWGGFHYGGGSACDCGRPACPGCHQATADPNVELIPQPPPIPRR